MKSRFYLFLFSFLFIGSVLLLAQPSPPENLNAVEGTSFHGNVFVKLNWTSPSAMVRFNVYRKNGALSDTGSFFRRASGLRNLRFDDFNVLPGRTYSYYVTAVNLQGESGPSNQVEIVLGNPPANGNVSGVVINDNTLLPIRGAFATFLRTSGFGMGITARTDSNGVFNVPLPAGSYYLKTGAYGYYHEFFDNVTLLVDATPVVVTEGSSLNLNIGLAPYVPPVLYTLSGSVKDSLDQPLMAIVKVFRVQQYSHHSFQHSVRTDSLGNYTINVREGDTVVVYAMPMSFNYFPEFWDNKSTYAEADRVPVSGNVTGINFVLSHKPVFENGITGVVADTNNTGVESFVSAIRLDGFRPRKFVVSTDEFGSYSFSNLIPGKYILFASPKAGYQPTFFKYDGSQTLNWRNADSVMVDENTVVPGINFAVLPLPQPGEGMISGTVTSNSDVLEAAYVYALNSNGEVAGFAITNPQGAYIINGLYAGDYQVYSDKIQYNFGTAGSARIDYLNNISEVVNLQLNPESVTGTGNTPQIVTDYQLYQNYPNPFNPVTNIKFSLAEKSNVKLTVYNVLGVQVSQLLNEVRNSGTHTISFDASGLSSGVYFYKLETGKFSSTKKLTVLK